MSPQTEAQPPNKCHPRKVVPLNPQRHNSHQKSCATLVPQLVPLIKNPSQPINRYPINPVLYTSGTTCIVTPIRKPTRRRLTAVNTPLKALCAGYIASCATVPLRTETGKMDPWLKNLLETKTGGFRAARWNRCHKCNEIVLTGINDDQCAGTVTVDPTPLQPTQELECLLANRATVSATPHGRTYDLHRRDDDLISNHPAGGGTIYGQVLPAHQCGNRYPGFFQRPSKTGWPTTPQF